MDEHPLSHDGDARLAAFVEAVVENTLAYDVVVVGGGMAGCLAAIAAGRAGARVLLVEQNAFLGGAATAGVVGQFVGWKTRSGRQVVKGLAEELTQRLQLANGCGAIEDFTMSTGHTMNRVQFDPEILKIVLDECVSEAGVDILFKSSLVLVEAADEGARALVIWAAGKLIGVRASAYVDASGDMALLKGAKAQFLDLEDGEALQPATMMFAMAPVDFGVLGALDQSERERIIAKGLQEGALPRAALHYSRSPGSEEAWFNISRVTVEPDDPFSLSRGEIEGRQQARRIADFLKQNLPGCGAARLSSIAPQLGIRDTRRMRGDYVIAAEDLRESRRFTDGVACGAYPIDIHHAGRVDLSFEEFGPDHYYRIPYRALLPQGLSNVIAAGRGISADHDAFAALRVMPTSMAIGQAAGQAAAMASHGSQGVLRAVDIPALQEVLRRQGVFLGD
jgi:hypothetical protein